MKVVISLSIPHPLKRFACCKRFIANSFYHFLRSFLDRGHVWPILYNFHHGVQLCGFLFTFSTIGPIKAYSLQFPPWGQLRPTLYNFQPGINYGLIFSVYTIGASYGLTFTMSIIGSGVTSSLQFPPFYQLWPSLYNFHHFSSCDPHFTVYIMGPVVACTSVSIMEPVCCSLLFPIPNRHEVITYATCTSDLFVFTFIQKDYSLALYPGIM